MLDVFRVDASFAENELLWEQIKVEILGGDDDEDEDEEGVGEEEEDEETAPGGYIIYIYII